MVWFGVSTYLQLIFRVCIYIEIRACDGRKYIHDALNERFC
jgi:hypothetical protein